VCSPPDFAWLQHTERALYDGPPSPSRRFVALLYDGPPSPSRRFVALLYDGPPSPSRRFVDGLGGPSYFVVCAIIHPSDVLFQQLDIQPVWLDD
jgi:hypothetical protein